MPKIIAGACLARGPDRFTSGDPTLPWSAGASAQAADWLLWESFRRHAIQSDGRVIERRADDGTTSETQAYGLSFALVADDRAQFERLFTCGLG